MVLAGEVQPTPSLQQPLPQEERVSPPPQNCTHLGADATLLDPGSPDKLPCVLPRRGLLFCAWESVLLERGQSCRGEVDVRGISASPCGVMGQDEGLTPGATLPNPVACQQLPLQVPRPARHPQAPCVVHLFYPLTRCLGLNRDEDLQPPTCNRGLRGPRVSGNTPVCTRGSPTRCGWSPHR